MIRNTGISVAVNAFLTNDNSHRIAVIIADGLRDPTCSIRIRIG